MALKIIRLTAVLSVIVIAYLTLGPVGVRAMSPVGATYDRAFAFAVIGSLAVLSAPRRPWLAALLVLTFAGGLEVAQRFTVDRHGHLVDVIEKLLGATIGIAVAYVIRWVISLRAPFDID
jgi:hypothetical protein